MESGRLLGGGDGGQLLHLRDSEAQEKDKHDVGTPLRLSVSLVPLTYDFFFSFFPLLCSFYIVFTFSPPSLLISLFIWLSLSLFLLSDFLPSLYSFFRFRFLFFLVD